MFDAYSDVSLWLLIALLIVIVRAMWKDETDGKN